VNRPPAGGLRNAGEVRGFWSSAAASDVDNFDIADAAGLASAKGIDMAVSNPCFELWLLLHHEGCYAYLSGYPAVLARLRKHVPTYDKTRLVFADFSTGVTTAIKHAKKLDPTGEEHAKNPSTSVWRLVEEIVGERDGTR
jgi:RloB-like protein